MPTSIRGRAIMTMQFFWAIGAVFLAVLAWAVMPTLGKVIYHTIYTRNNMGQKCEGNCGSWVLNKILKKTYPEILKKIVGAVWEIPAK